LDTWDLIGTTISKNVPLGEKNPVPENGTSVPLTEKLLRNIISLKSDQQRVWVGKWIIGFIEIIKQIFNKLAQFN